MWDLRWGILGLSMIVFAKTKIRFEISTGSIQIPYLVLLMLLGLLLWIAENIGTFYTIWTYPHQEDLWEMVSFQKIISWYLLVLTALAIVYGLYPVTQATE